MLRACAWQAARVQRYVAAQPPRRIVAVACQGCHHVKNLAQQAALSLPQLGELRQEQEGRRWEVGGGVGQAKVGAGCDAGC